MLEIANIAFTVLGVAVLSVVAIVFAVLGPSKRDQDRGEEGATDGKAA